MGEPNGEPTPTAIRPHQATSSHVQRRYVLALQARGRRFEPCCAHCFSQLEMIVREPKRGTKVADDLGVGRG
jgi:hypothetical protein